MRVELNVPQPAMEPRLCLQHDQVLATVLRPGFFEFGRRRSEMARFECYSGQMFLCHRHVENWVRTDDLHYLTITLSDAALTTACDGTDGEVELVTKDDLLDPRIGALVSAANAERTAGFPSGRLFLDSVEQALAAALVDRYAVRQHAVRTYRGGLGAARLRRIAELVDAKIEEELTLQEMAQSVGLSIGHFSRVFQKSMGESPHQFVLRNRIERAKEMLRVAEVRVLDVAVACGFKTQQHFARVFRRVYGASPTEYRQEFRR